MTAIHLSQLILEPTARSVVADLHDCHALHRRVMSAFGDAPEPGEARRHFAVLHRAEVKPGRPLVLLVQSNVIPKWDHLPAEYLLEKPQHKDVTERYATIQRGMRFRFRLRANPTKKIETKSVDGERRNGRRIELTQESDQFAWLHRKGSHGGFELVSTELGDATRTEPSGRTFGSDRGRRVTIAMVVFEGVLRVTDVVAFRESLVSGIGTGKAFGCGLLSIARS